MSHPTYNNMIIKTIVNLKDTNTCNKYSNIKIRKTMIELWSLSNTKRTRQLVKFALERLVENGTLIQMKQHYRFSAKFLKKKLDKRSRNKIRKVIKVSKKIQKKRKASKKVTNKAGPIKIKVIKKKRNARGAGLFGNLYSNGNSLFGNTSSSLFGNTGNSLFGNTSGGLFGNTGNSLFGNTGSSLFGNTGNSLFGNTGNSLYSINNNHSSLSNLIKKSLINPKENKPDYMWQYFDDNKNTTNISNDNWYDYDLQANKIVEEEWQRYIKNRAMNDVRAVKSGQFEYFVDFIGWKQTNIVHQDHKVRNIRRIAQDGSVTINPYSL